LLVSACLLGLCTGFDGNGRRRDPVVALGRDFALVPVCPEQLGGLATPRAPAEIQGGTGDDVLAGRVGVCTVQGADVTAAFRRGAEQVARIARLVGATRAVLKARSPSCATEEAYDGSFGGRLRPGAGVTTAQLRRQGVTVLSEEDVAAGCRFD